MGWAIWLVWLVSPPSFSLCHTLTTSSIRFNSQLTCFLFIGPTVISKNPHSEFTYKFFYICKFSKYSHIILKKFYIYISSSCNRLNLLRFRNYTKIRLHRWIEVFLSRNSKEADYKLFFREMWITKIITCFRTRNWTCVAKVTYWLLHYSQPRVLNQSAWGKYFIECCGRRSFRAYFIRLQKVKI